jgi:riboflavin transporter FmnP
MEGHIKAVAVLWIIYGALGLILTFLMFAALFGISFIPDMGHEAPVILRTIAIGLSVFLGLLTLPELLAGFGIYNHREWGRIVGLAVAFLNLISFPIGTALSVYTLVILFHPDTVPLFKAK